MPEKECPTRTVGPSCRASTRWAEATASGSVVRGFCTAVALSPAACNRAITSDQDDPSANSPCTRTTLRAFGAGCAAAAAALPWKRVLAAGRGKEKTPSPRGGMILYLESGGPGCAPPPWWQPFQVGASNMAWVMSVKPSTALPTPDACCLSDFLQRNMPSRISGRYGPVEEPASGASVVPSASPEAHSPPYNGGALWRKNPKSSKSCSMTR
jgi:hypothetical protein